jgi:hypothetical protein
MREVGMLQPLFKGSLGISGTTRRKRRLDTLLPPSVTKVMRLILKRLAAPTKKGLVTLRRKLKAVRMMKVVRMMRIVRMMKVVKMIKVVKMMKAVRMMKVVRIMKAVRMMQPVKTVKRVMKLTL